MCNLKSPVAKQARDLFLANFDAQPDRVLSVPGRVNLIGEHVDYHDLPVLPITIQRGIHIAFRASPAQHVRIKSEGYSSSLARIPFGQLTSRAPGDWTNYVLAAIQTAANYGPLKLGIDATIASDLPPAAGLSSSSALLIGLTLALLDANGMHPGFEELMNILPEGEQFVGTRGGGMDHAAILATESGSAVLVHFNPVRIISFPIPPDWTFLAAHSLTTAEKSGAIRAEYNSRREAGTSALGKVGFPSYSAALEKHSVSELTEIAGGADLTDAEFRSFLHVVMEAERVRQAVSALRREDAAGFGELLFASHASLRDQLRVSNRALDELVECAMRSGALGARLTGAGFGGYAILLCKKTDGERVRTELMRSFYAGRSGFDPNAHLFFAKPSAGVLQEGEK